MTRLVIKNCRVAQGRDTVVPAETFDVEILDEMIHRIVPADTGIDLRAGDAHIDGTRCLLAPGLINGHLHSHEHFQKGRFDALTLELWMGFTRPPRPVRLSSRQVYLRTLVGAIEAVRTGTTTVCDDVSIGPALDRAQLAAVHQAYEDIGLRALVGVSSIDVPFPDTIPFTEEEFEPALLAELRAVPVARTGDLLALAAELARARHPKANRVGFILAPSAPQRCGDDLLRGIRALSDVHDLPVMIHVQETRLQVVTSLLRSGRTFVEHLDALGFLKPATTLIHGVWLTPREIELIARSGATVQHNPWSNLRLGSGVAPVRALLDAGVNVSLATDGCSSTDTCNMLQSLGLAAALGGIRGDHGARVTAREAFRAATLGGAAALGRDGELGLIAEGAIADLVLYRLDSIPFVPAGDLIQQLVYAERGASVAASLVAGAVVFADDRFTGIDEPAILAEIASEFEALRQRYDEAEAGVARTLPALTRIQARCACHPIAADTYQARLA